MKEDFLVKQTTELMPAFENSNNNLDKLNLALSNATNLAGIVKESLNIFTIIKQIDYDIKLVDSNLQQFLKNADVNLEKFKNASQIAEKQLDNYSNKIDKILDKVLSIDSKTANEEEIKFRTELLKQVNIFGDTISSMLIKLMGI